MTLNSPTHTVSDLAAAESAGPPVVRDESIETGSLDGVIADLKKSPSDDSAVVHMAQDVVLPSAGKAEYSDEVTDEPALMDFVGSAIADGGDEPTIVQARNHSVAAVTSGDPNHRIMVSRGPTSGVVSDLAAPNEYRPAKEEVAQESRADDAPLAREPVEPFVAVARAPAIYGANRSDGARNDAPPFEPSENVPNANDRPQVQEPAEPLVAPARDSAFVGVNEPVGMSDGEPPAETGANVREADERPPIQESAEPTVMAAQEPVFDKADEPVLGKTDEAEPQSEEPDEADDRAEASTDDDLYEDGLKSIRDLSVDIRPEEGEMPVNVAVTKFSRAGRVRHAPGTNRPWPLYEFWWEAPAVAHRPLYFEEVNSERYGYSRGVVQPLLSGAHFFGKMPALPYMLTAEKPCDYVYTLGHYRPGSYAPHHIHYPPLSLRAAAVEAAAVTGLIFALP